MKKAKVGRPKKEVKKEEVIEAPIAPPELEEKAIELAQFVEIAEKWGIHRIRHAYHMLGDTKRELEKYK